MLHTFRLPVGIYPARLRPHQEANYQNQLVIVQEYCARQQLSGWFRTLSIPARLRPHQEGGLTNQATPRDTYNQA
jgi:hypothetical protein